MTPWLVVGLPALAAVLGVAVRRDDRLAGAVAVGAAAVTLLLAGIAWGLAGRPTTVSPGPRLRAGELLVPLDLLSDPTRAALATVVVLVALAVQVYSTWYLATDDRYGQFAATVSLFTSAMLLVVHSGDLLLTVVGWEVMGWCSYLLVGHWSRRPSARRAALKAFLVTRVADIGFVLGVVGLAAGAGTTSLAAVLAAWDRPDACVDAALADGSTVGAALTACEAPDARVRALLLVLLVIGVLGKSAQVPFQDWLADAMEGPTPASALIHAATMVAAGTVVLASVYPVFADSPTARWFLGLAVSVTMLLGALLAFAQSDLKRMLAWSTVSQVAVMLAGVAAAPAEAGPDAGLFHLWAHALFKSLLFLAVGWAALAAGGTLAVALRGAAGAAPVLRVAFAAGFLSLAGVPLVVGGQSKEHVLATVWDGAVAVDGPGLLVLVALVLTSAVTAAYSTRGYLVLTVHTRQRPSAGRVPVAVTVVLWLLVGLSVLGGLVVVTGAFRLAPISLLWLLLTTLVVGVGVAVALRGGLDRDPADVLARRLVPVADRGLGADALYRRLVARPVLRLARVVAFVDTEVVDAYVRGSAVATRATGWAGERLHRGERPSAGVGLVLGAVVVLGGLGVVLWS
ncbi:NADH-quinone oxidoreductase subunit L [Phycicoccus sp. CSK15P-2]|uniref:NADH-quinone oxidoreductase subunit 5 family protein n=1 Tax=Phycicoccus sp. CSK15P-2 TaxID=2807627 RepID=UPI00194F1888|nr:NADH-quinone oxidoreductase subunit L [Phycicoccus sp. CSK15P-2]MBM6404899.1 NADH-quinone oxidoreductase subunit L [Phycicoccus sp. CSK15P-2]